MTAINKDVLNILSTGVFRKLLDSDVIEIAQLNAAIAILIKANIDFDVSFTSGTRRSSPIATLKIYINPSSSVKFSFTFSSKTGIFC